MTGKGATVGYGKVFEEEYTAAVADRLAHPTTNDLADPSYLEYLRRDTAHQGHDGYFSIDKKDYAVESKREKRAEAAEGIGINDDARRGYDLGSVGNVGVMALPVWHEEAVLDPELLPLSYADSIPSASSRLASIALRAVSLSSASLSGVGGRDGFLSFESSAILSSEK